MQRHSGLTRPTDKKGLPGARELLGYRSSAAASNHGSGDFFNSSLPDNMTRYISNGGQVSVPSENLAFYFGGMRGPDWGPISSDDGSANLSANTLIRVNLTGSGDTKVWRNSTLPSSVRSRAEAQLVWIPASERGLLVVIGGVENPADGYPFDLSAVQREQNVRSSGSAQKKKKHSADSIYPDRCRH